jgi:ribosomal protein S18 acetylase RimI-like enzyme
MIKIGQGYRPWEFDSLLAINDACYENDERPTPTEFEQMISISEVFIATEALSDRIKGFAIVKEVGENTPYLWSIAVPPIYQHRGVGSWLLNYVCTKYNKLELHCRADSSVQKLYFDHGFRCIEVAKNYYKMGDKFVDGLKMRRES